MKMNRDLYAVILAGGSGTRFWPVSRQAHPKQFLSLTGKGSLLQLTLERVAAEVPKQNIWIAANLRFRKEIKRQTHGFGLKAAQMLWEPTGKNTAPAICWAAARIHAKNPDAVMSVFPSDHLIANRIEFGRAFSDAAGLARQDYLVTFGIVPTRAETGYGYLKTKRENGVLRVTKFIEKPSLAKAKKLIQSKVSFWNSGMFVFKTEAILRAFKKHLPKIYASRGQMLKGWNKLAGISIDYGILEKAGNVAAVAAAGIGWSDVGSWESLFEILPKDKNGNRTQGHVIALDCAKSFIVSKKRLVTVIGMENLLVIDADDALLVCPKARSQEVKTLVDILKKQKRLEI